MTATGLAHLLANGYSHDQISRFLAQGKFTQKDFWKLVKGLIRQVEHSQAVLVVDDTIEEKPYSSENELICHHWDHSKQAYVKGINLVNFLYCSPLTQGEEVGANHFALKSRLYLQALKAAFKELQVWKTQAAQLNKTDKLCSINL